MSDFLSKRCFLARDKVTLVVNSCDAYQDVWPLFFCALEEYWPERSIDVVLNTEVEREILDVKGFRFHSFLNDRGHDQWGMRLIKTLESIDTEYVIAVYDDFILEDNLETDKLAMLVEFMDQNKNVAVCYLTDMGFKTESGPSFNGNSLVLDGVDYRLNSAPGLWRREDLIKYTGPVDTPWAWEVFGSYRTFYDGKAFYAPVSAEDEVYKYNHRKGGAIYRGRWVADVVLSKNEKYQLGLDFSSRGFSSDDSFEKRSLKWKLNFMWLGFKMVGLKSVLFLLKAIGSKLR